MLGVLEAYRGTGAALFLKRFQRDWCLSHGVRKVVWTFDPLRGVNANFNLRKLGATARTYLPDHYGPMSGINAGAPRTGSSPSGTSSPKGSTPGSTPPRPSPRRRASPR